MDGIKYCIQNVNNYDTLPIAFCCVITVVLRGVEGEEQEVGVYFGCHWRGV